MEVKRDFPIDNCPICTQPLLYDAVQRAYYCLVPDVENWMQNSHYIVFNSEPYPEQSILLEEYLFCTSQDNPDKTIIAHQDDGVDLITLPRITDWSNPDKLIHKIKTLLVFL